MPALAPALPVLALAADLLLTPRSRPAEPVAGATARRQRPLAPWTRMRSPGSASEHRYGECVTTGELLTEIERRIAATPWRWTLRPHRSEAVRLRLARAHLRGSLSLRLLWPLAWAVGLSLVMAAFGPFEANLGLGANHEPGRTQYVALFMGLIVAALGRWATTSAAVTACCEVACEMDNRGEASDS